MLEPSLFAFLVSHILTCCVGLIIWCLVVICLLPLHCALLIIQRVKFSNFRFFIQKVVKIFSKEKKKELATMDSFSCENWTLTLDTVGHPLSTNHYSPSSWITFRLPSPISKLFWLNMNYQFGMKSWSHLSCLSAGKEVEHFVLNWFQRKHASKFILSWQHQEPLNCSWFSWIILIFITSML
jgi:hypothetical protein